jgi:hypothetical protein
MPGPPGSGLRDRPREPHSLHLSDRIRNVPFGEGDDPPLDGLEDSGTLPGGTIPPGATIMVDKPDPGTGINRQPDRLDTETLLSNAELSRYGYRTQSDDSRGDIAAAIEQSERPSGKGVPESAASARNADAEQNFYSAITIYGGTFVTGLFLVGENPASSSSWWFGLASCVVGGAGTMSVTPLFRNRFPNVTRGLASPRGLWAVAIVTWLLLAINIGFAVYDHFWPKPQPFTIGASPVGGFTAQPPAIPKPRVFTQKTVTDLTDVCMNRTTLQCDAFMTDQKGKWINIEGKIQSIWSDGLNLEMLILTDAEPVYCRFESKWKDRLDALRTMEAVKIAGEIGPTQATGQLYLLDCELQ